MADGTYYADGVDAYDPTAISVTFINEKGVKLIKYFDPPFKGKKFANKLKRSRNCRLVACSGFLI